MEEKRKKELEKEEEQEKEEQRGKGKREEMRPCNTPASGCAPMMKHTRNSSQACIPSLRWWREPRQSSIPDYQPPLLWLEWRQSAASSETVSWRKKDVASVALLQPHIQESDSQPHWTICYGDHCYLNLKLRRSSFVLAFDRALMHYKHHNYR